MTSLAQQLKRLAAPQSKAVVVTRERHCKSLLFDSKEAAALDRETFYAVGVNGLQELEGIDPSFQEFEYTLFDEASKSLERSILTQDVNDRLDRKIGRFLLRLSPYFLLKPAQKAMEWLIHRFSVHLYNVDMLLACVIPFHDTNIFVRVVQLLDLREETNKWHWLHPIQTPGVPLSRTTVITHCYRDPGFLQFVCELVPSAVKAHKRITTHSSDNDDPSSADEAPSTFTDGLLRVVTCFYCSAVVGAIECAKPVTEKFLSGILPYVLKGLKSKFSDYQASSYMITCQLAIKVKMKTSLVDPIVRSICKHMNPALAVEALSCVAILCHTQPLPEFPESAFQKLCTFSGTLSALELLSQAPNSRPLIKLVLTKLIHKATHSAAAVDQRNIGEEEGETYWALLQGIVHRVKLDDVLTKEMIETLLKGYLDIGKELAEQTELAANLKHKTLPVVAAMERRYPESMDSVIGTFMLQEVDSQKKNLLQELISTSLSTSKHQVVSGTETTLILSLNHANPSIRVLGVEHLKKRLAEGQVLEEFCIESLLQRLQDDKIRVVNATLETGEPLCELLPQEKLFNILMGILRAGKMKTERGLMSITLSLKLLTNGRLWGLHKDKRQEIVPIILPYLFYQRSETSDTPNEILDVVSSSTLQNDFKIFAALNRTYHSAMKRKLKSGESAVSSELTEILAVNLANLDDGEKKRMIDAFLDFLGQPQPCQAFYSVLISFVLLRAAHHSASELHLATALLRILEKGILTLLKPGVTIVKPDDPLPCLSGDPSQLPSGLHIHLHTLLMEDTKRQRRNIDSPLMHQSEVEATLWCLRGLISRVKMPFHLKTDTSPWVNRKPTETNREVYLRWLLQLMDLLTQAAGTKDRKIPNSPDFKNILRIVIQEHLRTPDLLWNFLCLVLIMPFESPRTQLYPVSPFYMARCLHMGVTSAETWANSADVVYRLLCQESEVFPSLLVVLSSELEPIRGAAIRCLQVLVSSVEESGSQTPYILLARFLVEKGGEIEADADYVKQALKLYFSSVTTAALANRPPATPTPRRKKKKSEPVTKDLHPKITCLNWLLLFIHNQTTPRFLQRALLLVLSEVQNEHILSLLLDTMNNLLRQIDHGGCLISDKAIILESIIQRLKPDTVAVLQHCLDDILLALTMETSIEEGKKSPQKMVLKQLTPAFFEAIPEVSLKQALLSKLFDQQVATKHADIAASIGGTLRKLPLDADLILTELDKLNTDKMATSLREARTRNVKEPEEYQWQRVTHVVELLQKKKLKKIDRVAQLVPALLAILSRCMETDKTDQGPSLEYLKQLLLTTVLNVCNQLSPDNQPLPLEVLNQEQFNIELVVQCIRTSDDPQTHRHALMLLATAAGLFPEHVLHNIMAIFTFMGANMLHRDDSYSFQVILRTVQTVIPALIKVGKQKALPTNLGGGVDDVVARVMRVFVDAFPHIPEHRRLPLFTQLLSTIGEETYLSRMLVLLIGGYVIKGAAAMYPGDEIDVKGPGRSIDFWLELCLNFTPDVQITSLTKLLEFVSTLTEDGELAKKRMTPATRRASSKRKEPKDSSNQELLFDSDQNVRARQMRQFRFTAVCFLPYIVSNSDFVEKLSEVSQEDADKLKDLLQRLLEVLLGYITQVARNVHGNAGKEMAKFWKVLLHRTYDALDKVNALLPPRIFIDVIANLLGNKLATIRRKALELLNNKLQQHQKFFDEEQNERLLGLITGLLSIVTATKHDADTDEVDVNRHTALYSLKLLCTLLGDSYPLAFNPVLDASVAICEAETCSTQVQGSAMLCLAECVCCLKAHSIRCLPRLMPRLLELLSNKETIISSDLHLLSAVTAVQKVMQTLPHFQSPYLVDLLLQICRLSDNSEDEKSQLNLRLKALSHSLASSVAVRVLLPVFRQAYDKMVETHKGSIGPLMGILSDHLVAMDKTDMTEYQQQAVTFFLTALDYRAKHTDDDLTDIENVEGHVIQAMLTFVMKLSEASFRPMFLKVVDWASRSTAPKDRLLTLYRLSDAIADKLKSLFTLFAGQLVAKTADLLDLNNTMKTDKPFFEDIANSERKSSLLITHILDCLHKCFLYDKGGFVSKERFERLMQPLVDQIENLQGGDDVYHDRVTNHLTPCIAQLLAASRDSATWQPLNYQVLLKTRHTSAKVRFAAMIVLQELHNKLAEDYLSLLPETIPFLAELMEDESAEVEQQCQSVVSELEKTLGEPLQKYF